MKADLPVTRERFFAAAKQHGLRIIPNVSAQRLKVAALHDGEFIIRFFAPDLRALPDGTQINGSVGVALTAHKHSSARTYEEALFHHILNLTELRVAERVIQQEGDWEDFFAVLRPALEDLPSTPKALADALADSTTWIGKQLSWGDASAVSFERRVRELAGH